MEKKVTKKEAAQIYRENNNRVVDDTVDGFVVLKDVNKIYDNRVQAVFDFNLSVAQNEFIVLVGPSGCGKSTTLRMIAGLEEISSGYLYIDKILSNYLESKDRDIAMVFQSYALYPNMSVFDNIGFGLKVRGVPKDEIKQKVFDVAEILDLGPYLDRKPRELSGGQMQRVALGRAIVRNSKLFLMDEPLSNLDAKLRVQMRSEIVKLHKNIHATTIYVTHDQTEAMTMADRIVIMNKGVVQQIDTPMEIYNDPKNVFVATFIGNPPMNVFKTSLAGGRLTCGDAVITLPEGTDKIYAEYIAERKAFFEDLKQKAELTPEAALSAKISEFISVMKKSTRTARFLRLIPGMNKPDRKQHRGGVVEILEIESSVAEEREATPDNELSIPGMKQPDRQKLREALAAICEAARALADGKGFIRFDAEREATLVGDLERGDFKGLKRDLNALLEDIKNTDLAIAGILKKFDSAGVFKNKSKDAEPASADKSKEKGKHAKTDLSTQNNELIDKYLDAYGAPDAAERVFVGIRPEDIHFAADFNGNKSEAFTIEASFVELLGSELNIYVDMFGMRMIMKSGLDRIVKSGDAVELCFDMNKLRLFDAISCERVM